MSSLFNPSAAGGHDRVVPAKMALIARRWLPAAFAVWLVACGGGGGDGGPGPTDDVAGPPTVSAILQNTAGEASQSVQAAVGTADNAAARASSLSGLSALLGTPIAGPSSAHVHPLAAPASGTARPLAVMTAACSDLFEPPCAGSASVDTNIADTATRIAAGDYADMQFASLSGTFAGESVALNGRMRIEFLSAIDLASTTFDGMDVKLKLVSFSGSINGAAFGPISDSSRLRIDAQGVATVTAGGATYSGLGGVTVTGAGHYGVANTTVRMSYWSDAGRYVDLTLQSWQVLGGRPTVGSMATVGGSGSIVVSATSASSSTVVYAVAVTAGGATTNYIVTASYPSGGGVPSYTAVPA